MRPTNAPEEHDVSHEERIECEEEKERRKAYHGSEQRGQEQARLNGSSRKQ